MRSDDKLRRQAYDMEQHSRAIQSKCQNRFRLDSTHYQIASRLLLCANRQLQCHTVPRLVRHPASSEDLASASGQHTRQVESMYRGRRRSLCATQWLHVEFCGRFEQKVRCRTIVKNVTSSCPPSIKESQAAGKKVAHNITNQHSRHINLKATSLTHPSSSRLTTKRKFRSQSRHPSDVPTQIRRLRMSARCTVIVEPISGWRS